MPSISVLSLSRTIPRPRSLRVTTSTLVVCVWSEQTISSGRKPAAAANRLKNQLTEEVSCGLSELDENGISIPIGTLLGIPVFSGKGHGIDLGVQQLGAVKSEFSSKLEAAGINQTRLTVYVTITVEIRAILPNGHRDISVCEEQIINDSLIVGDIPQYYRQS